MKRMFAVLVVLVLTIVVSCKEEPGREAHPGQETSLVIVSGGKIPGTSQSVYVVRDMTTNQCFAVSFGPQGGWGDAPGGIVQAKCSVSEAAR